jgi:hypothetical protein
MMNGLIFDLLAQSAPWKVVVPLLLLTALILLIRTIATGIATVVKAMHPGGSADAVQMQVNRIQHRQFMARRRDANRRARAARRARAWEPVRSCFRVDEPMPQIILPGLVLPSDELLPNLTRHGAAHTVSRAV